MFKVYAENYLAGTYTRGGKEEVRSDDHRETPRTR